MRQLTLFATLLALGGGEAVAEEVMYHDNLVPTIFSNDAWQTHRAVDFTIRYDTRSHELVLLASDQGADFGFALNRAEADSLIGIIDKYKRWNLKASAMDVELEKEIAPLPVSRTFWRVHGKSHRGRRVDLPIYFFSQTEEKHHLVITFPRLAALPDGRQTYEPQSLYFDWTNAVELRRALEKDVLKRFLEKPRTRRQIAEQFK